jgi:tRNA(Ile)-lysidine synthase
VVADTAARLGADFVAHRVVVDPGPNLEARARAARRGVLPPDALLGHTLDDQAETVLLNVLRGAGIDGLAGIRADARHPILALRRTETREVCERLDLRIVLDPSNDDPRFRRNRIRHEVLPLLDEVAGREVAPLLARLAAHAREAADQIDHEACAVDVTDARQLGAAPPAIAAAAVRRWLRTISAEHHPPDHATVERVLAVARGESLATDVGQGWRVTRSSGVLRLLTPDS